MSRPKRGYSPALGNADPRSRQANDIGIEPGAIAAPLMRDNQGRATIKAEGALRITPTGGVEVNVAHGLAIQTGSPQRVVARTSRTIVVGDTGNLEARINARDVQGLREFIASFVSPDISYGEVLMSETAPGDEAQPLFNSDGTDWVYSEVLT